MLGYGSNQHPKQPNRTSSPSAHTATRQRSLFYIHPSKNPHRHFSAPRPQQPKAVYAHQDQSAAQWTPAGQVQLHTPERVRMTKGLPF